MLHKKTGQTHPLLRGAVAAVVLAAAAPSFAANHEVWLLNIGTGGTGTNFIPNVARIEPGDTVTFRSRSIPQILHNVASADGSFRCALGCDGAGGNGNPTSAAFSGAVVTFPNEGTYDYRCEEHQEYGTIIVGDPASPPPQDDMPIDAGFTGGWYNPAQSGHGFNIEVLPNGGLLAYWYVFDSAGTPAWIVAQGEIDGDVAVLEAYRVSGGAFPPDFDPDAITRDPWGEISFTFTDCNNGHVAWDSIDPGFADGEMDVVRLTLPAGLACPQQ